MIRGEIMIRSAVLRLVGDVFRFSDDGLWYRVLESRLGGRPYGTSFYLRAGRLPDDEAAVHEVMES